MPKRYRSFTVEYKISVVDGIEAMARAGHTTIIWIRQKAVSPSKLLAKLLVKLQLPKNAAGAVLQASRKLTPPSRTGIDEEHGQKIENTVLMYILTPNIKNYQIGFNILIALLCVGQGRTEPVPVEVKNNRQGVGTVRRPKHKLTLRAVSTVSAAKQARVETEERRDFRQRMSDKFALVGTLQDLAKSQRVCYQLDQAKGLSCVQSWFWPPECRPGADSDNEDEDDDQPDDFKLQLVTKHLRSTHFYCVWCGSGYKDTEEMISLCPGDTARDHDD
ncbi:G patch domain-containing protein 11-like [Corticium candelabrum]|uniref:G patch domain-containing protein 11-like n=1 Tax=Corticium candelabrum TaxID=121492 RepID=UPI002E25B6AF|nr:G patch domain-containing protein 11-like [Corticium candelabrum]